MATVDIARYPQFDIADGISLKYPTEYAKAETNSALNFELLTFFPDSIIQPRAIPLTNNNINRPGMHQIKNNPEHPKTNAAITNSNIAKLNQQPPTGVSGISGTMTGGTQPSNSSHGKKPPLNNKPIHTDEPQTSAAKLPKRKRPKWDNAWKKIHPAPGNHRRHILMSRVMRSALYAATDSASKNPKNFKKAAASYERLLRLPPNTIHTQENLRLAEEKIASRMHNHKFNIYLGQGPWDSSIATVAQACHGQEAKTLINIRNANNSKQVAQVMNNWSIKIKGKSARPPHRREIVAVADKMVQDVLGDQSLTLEEKKEEMAQIVTMLHDTSATDISDAANPVLKKVQNAKLIPIQSAFLQAIEQPDIDRFEAAATSFLITEIEMAKSFDIDLQKVNACDKDELAKLRAVL